MDIPPAASSRSASPRITIEDASVWVLRGGLALSMLVMLIGIVFSFLHGTATVQRMSSEAFEYRPSNIWQGIRRGHGKSIIEAGIYLLVLTPVLRVATSMILFAFSGRDWVYVLITALVLALTLAGLL